MFQLCARRMIVNVSTVGILTWMVTLPPAAAQTPPFSQTVIVSPTVSNPAASGNTLLAAVNGLPTASSGRRFLVKIEPGVYDLRDSTLQMKPWVDIEGSGRKATLILGRGHSDPGTYTAVVSGADNSELRSLMISVFDDVYAVALANEGSSGSFRDLQISASRAANCWGVRNSGDSQPEFKDIGVYVDCSGLSIGLSATDTSRAALEDVTIRALGGGSLTSNIGLSLNSSVLPSQIEHLDIRVGDASAPGIGIDIGGGPVAVRWLEIVDTYVGTYGGIAIHSDVGIPLSLSIQRCELVGNDVGIQVPSRWIKVQFSVVAGTTHTISSPEGSVRVASSQLDGGPLDAMWAQCGLVVNAGLGSQGINHCP